VIELHIAAANLVTASGGKIDTNNNGVPGESEDDVYKNIAVYNSASGTSLSGGSTRNPWNTQSISGSISRYGSDSDKTIRANISVIPSPPPFRTRRRSREGSPLPRPVPAGNP